jgi:5'-nucleotidase
MRKLVLGAIAVFALVAFACSGDDPATPPPEVVREAGAPDAGGEAAPDEPRVVHVLALSDFHGALDATPVSGSDVGGAAFLAAHVKKRSTPDSVFVAAGDLVGASPLASGYFHDESAVDALGAAGLALSGVGNHEFDEGSAELLRLQNGGCHPVDGCRGGAAFTGAKFKFLAANVRDRASGKTLFPPYEVRAFGPARVAFVGMTLQATPQTTIASMVKDLDFAEEVGTVDALLPELRAQNVTAVVVLLHQGSRQSGGADECAQLSGPIADLARRMPVEVRAIVSGHSHVAYNCLLSNKVVTNSGAKGLMLTDIELRFDRASGAFQGASAKNVTVSHDVAPDPAVQAIVDRYEGVVAPIASQVVGTLAEPIGRAGTAAGESALGDLVADSMLAAGGGDVAFMNNGGIRADLPAGAITYAQAYEALPFGNALTTVTMTGAELLAYVESNLPLALFCAGMTYAWSPAAPAGSRVAAANVTVGGAPLALGASYRVTLNALLLDELASPKSPTNAGLDLDAFTAYLKAKSPVSAPPLNRITTK